MRTVLLAAVLALAGCASSHSGSDAPVENCAAVRSAPELSPGDWHGMVNSKADETGQNEAILWRTFQDYIVANCPSLAPAVGR